MRIGFDYRIGRGILKADRIIHPYSLRNLTQKTLTSCFPDIPEKSVRHRHLLIAGLPESGKTIQANYLARYALKKYGSGLVNIVAVNSTADAIDQMDSKPVQLIIIDDAIKEANSRLSGRNAGDISDFYQIRHVFEERSRSLNGIVITIYISQRFKSLDIVFRNAHAIIFKTVATDPEDAKAIRKYIGKEPYDYLQNITNRIYYEADDLAKSEAVVCLCYSNQSGSFKSPFVEPFLRFKNSDMTMAGQQTVSFEHNEGKLLEKYQRKPGWRLPARIYYLHRIEHKTWPEIAEDKRIGKCDSDCRLMERKMRGELSRVIGQEYENWKANDLEKRGFKVQRGGGNSEADIIAVNEKGLKSVYSCKCLRYDRRVKLPLQEIRPEINQALRDNCEIVLSVWNMHDDTEHLHYLKPDALPSELVIDYVKKGG